MPPQNLFQKFLKCQCQLDETLIALRYPRAVLCLHSAARLWRLTDEYAVDQVAAVPPGVNRAVRHPGVKLILWTNPALFDVEVVEHQFAGVLARVTDPARTVTDFFRPRHQQPLEDAMKALGFLIARDGEDALNRVEEYAWTLGWGASVTTATRAFRETFHVHAPQR